jgi:phage I-like protein
MKIAPAKKKAPTFFADGERIDFGDAAEQGPKWHKVFGVGRRHRGDFGPNGIDFSKATLATMAKNFADEGKPERAVNYFHKGASHVDAPIADKVAAGWVKDVELRDDGLYAKIGFTERAKGFILADELRYLSPEFRLSQINKTTGKEQGPTFLGAALLNDPFLTELPRVAASDNPQDTSMEFAAFLAALKLAADATPEQINARISALTAAEGSTVALAESAGQVTKLAAEIKERDAVIAKLQGDTRAAEVKAFCDAQVAAGRLAPAVRAHFEKLGVDGGVEAIKFVEQMPVIVALNTEKGTTGAASADPKKDATARFNAKRDELHKAAGGKAETFMLAHNEARAALPEDFALAFSVTPAAKK